jgi:hypothetical protein
MSKFKKYMKLNSKLSGKISKKKIPATFNSIVPLSLLYSVPKESILNVNISENILIIIGIISFITLLIFKRFVVNKSIDNNYKIFKKY